MDWFFKLVRIAGVNFPVAASLVQLQAEIDSNKIEERLNKLEDPISYLHEDVQAASKEIYKKLCEVDSLKLDFTNDFYKRYRRPIAALSKKTYISVTHVIGSEIPRGVTLTDPTFIIYMCALAENKSKMQQLFDIVDNCEVGKWLNGEILKNEIGLPVYVIRAVFEIFESKGYGILSKTIGTCDYMGKA
jgi:hypothetical protein